MVWRANRLATPWRLLTGAALLLCAAGLTGGPARGAPEPLKFALALSMTGPGSFYGVPAADGARLAVEEANAAPGAAPITFDIQDDASSPQKAAEIAGRLAESDVPVVVGPSLTVAAMLAGPVYGRAGLASIVATSHGDEVVAAPTIFQPIFNTGEMGMSLANYLLHVLGQQRAVVLYRDDAYGRPLAAGFRQAAERLGMDATYRGFSDDAGRDAAARMALAEPGHPAVALGMLAPDAVPLIKQLRRAGAASTILGPSAISGDDFANLFAAEPEEQAKPGFFTNNLYAASPMLFDSADAETIAFASRFRSRFGREPDWQSIQGYDATRLAVAALRDMASATGGSGDRTMRRDAVRHFLLSLDGPDHAVAGVTGPLWFKPDRGRAQPVRIGRFQDRMFESAPIQLVPVSGFDDSEMESGAVIALGHGRYARRQLVVFTGLLLNEMARLDIAQSRLSADIYLWMRYPEPRGGATANPDDIAFPDLLRGSSDGMQLERSAILADGTRYRLWRLHGDFRNEFDLRRFPVDRQTLLVRFFNAHAASDSLIYALDRRAPPAPAGPDGHALSAAAAGAFRELPQWEPLSAVTGRDTLVTQSGLGNPRLIGLEQRRELSGFTLNVKVRRRVAPTLLKNLLPLALMSLIVYATLHFPGHLLKEKVTVTVTGALSGAVLLSAINSQLGGLGYVLAVEYLFYAFFALCLFCIISFVAAERYRIAKNTASLDRVELGSRFVYIGGLFVTVATAIVLGAAWYG